MKYLLDTNICIYIIHKKSDALIRKVSSYKPFELGISSITLSELIYGVEKSTYIDQNREALIEFITPFTIYNFDSHAAQIYGKIRVDLERKGTPIGAMDLLIASHAISMNMTVVTNNEREFKRIDNIKVENWK